MKKEYKAPLCEVCEMETQDGMLQAVSGPNSINVDNTPAGEFLEGDANKNSGWDLW